MGDIYNIKIGDEEMVVTTMETTSREITISGRVFIIPAELLEIIESMAGEIQQQQQRKVATDRELNDRIGKRIDRMLKALDRDGMLKNSLEAEYPLPPNVEVSGGRWTFFDAARETAKQGLRNEFQDDLAEEIGGQFEKPRRTI